MGNTWQAGSKHTDNLPTATETKENFETKERYEIGEICGSSSENKYDDKNYEDDEYRQAERIVEQVMRESPDLLECFVKAGLIFEKASGKQKNSLFSSLDFPVRNKTSASSARR